MKSDSCEEVSTMLEHPINSECHLPMAFKTAKDQRRSRKRCKWVDSVADAAVERLFNKRYEIKGEFSLPPVETMFAQPPWSVDRLQSLKRELNETKSKLDDYDLSEWNYHTRRRNKGSAVLWRLRDEIKVEYLTQAWCKLYENVCLFPLVPENVMKMGKFNSVHLCEAPGAFVAALNHWLKSKAPDIDWNWLGTTLNPHYEGHSLTSMVNVDSLINRTENNWFYGTDNTGNLMNLKNLDALVAKTKNDVINLVTADGSIDCVDTPDEQEQVVSHLHYCETVAALHLLAKGGNFLLKIFTIFENRTVCLIYLLACCFEKIIFNKPVNSREGNSELYVICLGFSGSDHLAPRIGKLRSNYENLSDNSMFRREDIPESFLSQIMECGEFFKAHQCEAILTNIRTFRGGRKTKYVDPDIEKIKQLVAERFIKTYEIKSLASEKMTIIGTDNIKDCSTVLDIPETPSSYNSRRKKRDLDPKEQLYIHSYGLDFIDVPSDGEKFKLNVLSDEITISKGKPYRTIESSKFCASQILYIFNRAIVLGNEIGQCGQIPSPEIVEEFTKEKEIVGKILTFGYTSAPDNNKLIKDIWDALVDFEENQNLVLLGYPMLSRLSVGLLYVLGRTFDSVEIEASVDLGCIITLKVYKKDEKVLGLFRQIVKASIEAEENGEAVISILSIKTIYGSSQIRDIGRMNHGAIRHCVRKIVANSE